VGPDLCSDAVGHSLAILASVKNYNRWLFNSFRRYVGQEVLEVGAGIGNITQFLLDRRRVVCLEPFEPFADYLKQRLAAFPSAQVLTRTIQDCPADDLPSGQFDTVLCLNVLEHIEDDDGALVRMRRMLRPGGRAIVLAPAMPRLFGQLDREMGHVRRYTRGSLKKAFMQAGLSVQTGRYMNLAGVLGWWLYGRALGRERIPKGPVSLFDHLVPLLGMIERFIPLPLGQSILMVGLAPAATMTERT
jgi:SAM-dependent methyltransferase